MSVPSYIKLSPNMDMATLINALNTNFNIAQSQDRRKVITDEDGNDRIIIGKRDDGTYGIKMSEKGVGVGDATPTQIIFDSDNNLFKIVASDTIELNRGAGVNSVYTDIPIEGGGVLLAWATITNASPSLTFQIPYMSPYTSGQMGWGVRAYFDTHVGIVRIFNEAYQAPIIAQAYNMSIKYYILRETVV